MDSDDEVVGASFRAERRSLDAAEKPESPVKRDVALPAQAPGVEEGGPDAEKAALLRIIWARVKGFPPWPVRSTLAPTILPQSPRLVQPHFMCIFEVPRRIRSSPFHLHFQHRLYRG